MTNTNHNIAAKPDEQSCCAFYHQRIQPVLEQIRWLQVVIKTLLVQGKPVLQQVNTNLMYGMIPM